MGFRCRAFPLPVCSRRLQRMCVEFVLILGVYYEQRAQAADSHEVRDCLRRTVPTASFSLKAGTLDATNEFKVRPRVPFDRVSEDTLSGTSRRMVDEGLSIPSAAWGHYRQLFAEADVSSMNSKTATGPCDPSPTKGLEAVTFFFEYLVPDERPQRGLERLFSSEEPLSMLSARRGRFFEARVRKGLLCCSVEDDNEQLFSVTPGSCLTQRRSPLLQQSSFLEILRRALKLPQLFKVDSLDTVECSYRVKTIQDVVMYPRWGLPLETSASSFSNLFVLYRPSRVTLRQLAKVIESTVSKSPELAPQAEIARLNLSLQLLDIIGRIRLKRLVLSSFSSDDILLDQSGTMYILPEAPFRRETGTSLSGKTRKVDASKNAWDTAAALLNLWWPTDTGDSQRLTFDRNTVTEDVAQQHFRPIPDALLDLVTALLSGEEEIDVLRYTSGLYESVQSLLEEELQRQAAKARGLSTESVQRDGHDSQSGSAGLLETPSRTLDARTQGTFQREGPTCTLE